MPPWKWTDTDALIMAIDEYLGSGNGGHALPHMALQFFLTDRFDDDSSGSGMRRTSLAAFDLTFDLKHLSLAISIKFDFQ